MTKQEQSVAVIDSFVRQCVQCKKRLPLGKVGATTGWCIKCADTNETDYWKLLNQLLDKPP